MAPPPAAAPAQPPPQACAGQGQLGFDEQRLPQPLQRRAARGFAGGIGGGGWEAVGRGFACRAQAKPTATGVRPIRIEVPRTGQSFTFTKVLNAGRGTADRQLLDEAAEGLSRRADGIAGLRIRARPVHALVAVAAARAQQLVDDRRPGARSSGRWRGS